jgi:hypothetical protein
MRFLYMVLGWYEWVVVMTLHRNKGVFGSEPKLAPPKVGAPMLYDWFGGLVGCSKLG